MSVTCRRLEKTNGLRLGHWLLFVIGVSFLLDASMRAAAFVKHNQLSTVGPSRPALSDQKLRLEIESWREKVNRRFEADSMRRAKSRFDFSEEFHRSARENPTGRTIRQL